MEIITNFYQNNYNEYLLNIQNSYINVANNIFNLKMNNDNNLILIIITIFLLYLFITLGISFIKKFIEFNLFLFITVFSMSYFNKKEVVIEETNFWNSFW